MSRKLALQVLQSRFRPNVVVAIARGGYVPARILCDFLDVYDLRSLRVEHYRKGAAKKPRARLVDRLGVGLNGKRVLIVDDVSDTGDTFDVSIAHIAAFQPRDVKTAVLHHKTVSHYIPDFFAQKVVRWRWFIYPWAVLEDLSGFLTASGAGHPSVARLAKHFETAHGVKVPRATLDDLIRITPRAGVGG